jgi:hypothetical protein
VAVANGPYRTVAGGTVVLTAAGSTDAQDGPTALKYEWLLNDAVIGTGAQYSHVFPTASATPYTVTLRVTDTKNLATTATATVTVDAPPAPSPTTGTMSFSITDAPFPFDSVQSANMFVQRVDARFTEPTAAELQAGVGTDPATSWVTVATPNQAVNLLDLQRGKTLSLGQNTAMPAGTYRGFRIVLAVNQSNITLKGGATPTIAWGVNATSVGYAITATEPVTLAANGVVNVLADFDLGRSFDMVGATPSAGGFVATPSIRTIRASQRGQLAGRVVVAAGATETPAPGATVELLLPGTSITDQSRDKIVATAGTDASAVFVMAFLQPGTYVLRLTFPPRYNASPNPQGGTVTVDAPAAASRTPSAIREFRVVATQP